MVYVLLADGFEEVEALTPVDMLRRAGADVKTVGIGGRRIVGARGIPVVADLDENEVNPADMQLLILPGGNPGYVNLENSEFVQGLLASALQNEKCRIAAICAAPTLLGHLGALKNKTATCYPGMEGELDGAVLSDAPVCVDGRIITSRSAATAMEFALTLTELLQGAEARQILQQQIAM